MSDPFLVEVWGEPAGYVLQEGAAFRFHALAQPFTALDGAQFAKPGTPGSPPPACALSASSRTERRSTP